MVETDVQESSGGSRVLAVTIPGVAMCLGWGLAGQYGGSYGAMIPGVLGALALVLVARRRIGVAQSWMVAMAGALGFAIGGDETYGQTIGLTAHPGMAAWAFLGMFLKGAVWGGIGGLFIGAALGNRRYTTTQILVALNLALALSFVGYWLINEPKLIYFSGHAIDAPRTEGWAGLWVFLLVLVVLAGRMHDRAAVRLSFCGVVGCGFGFALGNVANRLGMEHLGSATAGFIDWWKVMECTCGLAGGLALGWGWAGLQQDAEMQQQGAAPATEILPIPVWLFVVAALDVLFFYYLTSRVDALGGWIGVVPFVFTVPAVLLVARDRQALQLVVGVVAPIMLVLWDMQRYWSEEKKVVGAGLSMAALVLLSALAAAYVARVGDRPRVLFLFVAWFCTICAWAKMGWPAPEAWGQMIVVQGLFTIMAAWLTLALRERPGGHAVSAI
jgi:hypothetical protein